MSRVVARIGKPHGIRGEVTVQLHTDDPATRLAVGALLKTRSAPGSGVPHEVRVRSARVHRGTWLLAFDGIPDRTGALGLRGTRLLAPEAADAHGSDEAGDTDQARDIDQSTPTRYSSAAPAASAASVGSADEWYPEELVGLPVVLPDGSPVGQLAGLQLGSAQDRLVVALAGGGRAVVPFVAALVPVVDVPGRRIVVDPPPGLLELEA